jgi:hypothetical protein
MPRLHRISLETTVDQEDFVTKLFEETKVHVYRLTRNKERLVFTALVTKAKEKRIAGEVWLKSIIENTEIVKS